MPEPPIMESSFSLFFLKIFAQADTSVVQPPLRSNAYDEWLKRVMAAANPAILKTCGVFTFFLHMLG